MAKLVDLTGRRFGRLVVIKRVENIVIPSGQNQPAWLCQCNCGNMVVVTGHHLKQGHTKSCGCLNSQKMIEMHITHGKSHTRLHNIWIGMKNRCYNPHNRSYDRYGGRGITVCEEWRTDFTKFYDWSVANGYAENLSIDRIDNSKGYSPDNCRWANDVEQTNNQRKNLFFTIQGEKKTLAEWCKVYGVIYSAAYYRITHGWSIEEALELVPRKKEDK